VTLKVNKISIPINALFWSGNPVLKLVILLVVGFLFPAVSFSQSGPVTNQLIFGQPDSYGIGPRAIGMGGAFTAVADDASAAYWNVAGLAQISSYELTLSSAPVYFTDNLNGAPAFGFPWYASMQFMVPIAKENTLGISFFRPFHPQRDFYAGNQSLSSLQREEGSYLQNPSFQQSEIVLSYAARFSAVRNFSVGINIKRITNDPYYIRYFGSDPSIQQTLANPVRVIGYGVDIGLLYRIPISKYSEEFRIGLALNDLVSHATYSNGLVINPTNGEPFTTNHGPGSDISIPPEITLGIAYKNDYFFKIRNITSFDFDQISDPDFGDADNKIIRFGTEFWFFKDVLGIRAGYSTPLSRPGDISLGGSVRALGGDFELDAAYLQPVGPAADINAGSAIGTINTGGINYEPFHIGATYRFGGGEEIPPPKVRAFVRPASFSPSQGEKATFYLDTTEDVSVNHWSVLLYDQSNHLARGLRGNGSPPTKLVWGGENDQYEPLPPGVYTWAFQVQDQLEHVGSTPVQTVEILGPPEPEAAKDAAKLLAIRQQQAALLSQERQQLTALAQQSLRQLLGIVDATPTTANANGAQTPVEAGGNTNYPAMGLEGVKNLTPGEGLNSHKETDVSGNPMLVVSYKSKLNDANYVIQEAADVMKNDEKTVGTKDFKSMLINVYYGQQGNVLSVKTNTEAVANYETGKIDLARLKQLSEISINGVKVGPNGQ
jgi:hypothetical protein